MKKIKYRIRLVFTFLMSQMILPYILPNIVVMFKVAHMISGDFKSLKVILAKYITHITSITHIIYKLHIT